MFRAQIIIQFTNGQILSYANKDLAEKEGTDEAGTQPIYDREDNVIGNADVTTPLFKGYPEYNYYYTGYGNDTFDDQTGSGKVKGDFEFIKGQIDYQNYMLKHLSMYQFHIDNSNCSIEIIANQIVNYIKGVDPNE